MEVECKQKFLLDETMKLERTEFCLLGKEFRDAYPAALVGKFGDKKAKRAFLQTSFPISANSLS